MTVLDTHPYGATLNAKDAKSFTDASAAVFKNISWARLQFAKKLERWTQNDAQMSYCAKYGILPDIVLQNFADADLQPGATQMPTPQAAANYALQIFQRYGNAARCIEVLNEEPSFEQNAAFKTPQVYIPIVQAVSDALRGAGYTGLLGGFGFTNYDTDQEIYDWYNGFFSDPSNPGRLLDACGLHFYHHGLPPDTPTTGKPALTACYTAYRNAALASNHGQKPLWVTEIGYCVNPDTTICAHPVTEQQAADYLQQAFDIARLSGVIDHMFLFTLSNEDVPFNIVNPDLSPRPAYTMVQGYAGTYASW